MRAIDDLLQSNEQWNLIRSRAMLRLSAISMEDPEEVMG